MTNQPEPTVTYRVVRRPNGTLAWIAVTGMLSGTCPVLADEHEKYPHALEESRPTSNFVGRAAYEVTITGPTFGGSTVPPAANSLVFTGHAPNVKVEPGR